ncbi:hypothetical protein [Streptomyces sp. G-G2]|uniref:hypothetical protein n=1 Tax=Streptomyces sp. G-G2 TaxID=3046201 RepID=UPI0024BAFDD8|nr:hypothetical protein [Streptomyces sp. G-G2]MDJ0380021.1 hypothetical protein [Streptomyces sp. G-G2]
MTLPVRRDESAETVTAREVGRADRRPDYPPRTPPPPRRPVESPRPERAFAIVNRRAANWALESQLWSAVRFRRLVLDKLTAWRYLPDPHGVGAVVTALVAAAVADGGRRISLHLAAREGQACIAVLSHLGNPHADGSAGLGGSAGLVGSAERDGRAERRRRAGSTGHAEGRGLRDVAGLPGLHACGSEADPDGHRVWAVFDVPLRTTGTRDS